MKRLKFTACLVILLLLVPSVPATYGPTITGISPVSGPNNGVVTITVTGTGLDTLALIRLNKCARVTGGSGQPPFAGTVISRSANSVTARFDLTGKAVGSYDVSLNAPWEGIEAWAVASGAFTVYQGSGAAPVVTATAPPVTTLTTTATTVPQGENSVYFDTWPPWATIYLDGEEVGLSPFMYYTNHEGTYPVVVRKDGYETYEATVTIYRGKQVHFIAPLTTLSSSPKTTATTKPPATTTVTTTTTATKTTTTATTTATTVTATATPAVTTNPPATPATTEMTPATPGTTATPFPKYSIPIPTPWPTDTPAAEKSPAGPALVPGAVVLAMVLVVMRRRQDRF